MFPRRTQPYSDEELLALVQGMPTERLRENYARAAEHPGTEWHGRLLAELLRRGLDP